MVVPVHHSIGKCLLTSFINVFFFREFLVLIRFSFRKFTGDWEPVIVPENADERRRKVIHWSRWAIGLHLVIIVASVLSGCWKVPILITFSSAYGLWFFYLYNFTQHAGPTENIDDFRLNCRTILINPISRFLYWHIEHHMYAAVPCYHLKRLHEAIRHELPLCPNRLIEAWVEIAYMQYRRRDDPEYRFLAELPDEQGCFSSESSRLQQVKEQADRRFEGVTTGKRWECSVCGFV